MSGPCAPEPTRERVRTVIGEVGGYWRPLAGAARLQEELGELAELLVSGSGSVDELAAELADLWIISTALADQFLGSVAEPDSTAPRAVASAEQLSRLVVAAGRIARIVNHYDGPKTPHSFDGWISLEDAVAEFHCNLEDVARAHDVNLADAVKAKLDAIPTRDAGRFGETRHDPSTAAALDSFRAPYTSGSVSPADRLGRGDRALRLWGSPELPSGSPDVDVEAIVRDLIMLTKAAPWEQIDGYLICAPTLTSTMLLEQWLAGLLSEIAQHDPGNERPHIHIDGDTHRSLSFNGLMLTAEPFSPLYPPLDSRHLASGTFLLLSLNRSGSAPAR